MFGAPEPPRRAPEGRPDAGARGYGATWRKLRARVLASEPRCRMCAAEGRTRPAVLVDHVRTIREAPHLRLDPGNLQPLCTPCHAVKTADDVRRGAAG